MMRNMADPINKDTDDKEIVLQTRRDDLKRHMLSAAARDMNPWIRGYAEEKMSKLASLHPSIGRQVDQEIGFQNDGWLTADGLYLIAELAESKGAGLVNLSGLARKADILALKPENKDLPWNSLRRASLSPPEAKPKTGLCPFWGPCLGRKIYLAEAAQELADLLEPEIPGDFRIELAGCPTDCGHAAVKADLAIVFDTDAAVFVLWIGGRHRPFRKRIIPRCWLQFNIGDSQELMERIFIIRDVWDALAAGSETLPELVERLSLNVFEQHMALGAPIKPRRVRSALKLADDLTHS
jgi:dissimilatory sulfite reductase (desulfoviridin) alpha/beta subunit